MNENTEELDNWLEHANTALIRSSAEGLDVEAMLTRVKRAAVPPLGGVPGAADAPSGPYIIEIQAALNDAVRGEPEAVDQLVAAVTPLVVRYCRARAEYDGMAAAADDIARATLVQVVDSLPRYTGGAPAFLGLVIRLARQGIQNAERVAARRHEVSTDTAPARLVDAQRRRARRMAELLAPLPERDREIVVLRMIVGLSAAETATVIGATPGTVRMRQHRALTRMREMAGQHGAVDPVTFLPAAVSGEWKRSTRS